MRNAFHLRNGFGRASLRAGLESVGGRRPGPGWGSALAVLTLLLGVGCTRIGPDETGVRSVNLGPNKGIVQRDFGPGYHRYLWPLDSWNRFPSTVQHMRFAQQRPGPVPEGIQFGEALQVTSADGDRVTVLADVFYRIADDRAYRVLQDSGPGDRFVGVVRTLAQDATRVVFGRLRTEEFYEEDQRESARLDGVTLLRERLEPRGIELVDLLVETVEFDPNYEKLIQEKKIADQRVELEKALARAAAEEGRVTRIRVETEARVQQVARETQALVMEIHADTELTVARLRAEADRYGAARRAEADLNHARLEAQGREGLLRAEAEGMRRKNEALGGAGGRNLVALEAVRHLNLVEVTFPSLGIDWLNPEEMARRIGAEPGLPELAPAEARPSEAVEGLTRVGPASGMESQVESGRKEQGEDTVPGT